MIRLKWIGEGEVGYWKGGLLTRHERRRPGKVGLEREERRKMKRGWVGEGKENAPRATRKQTLLVPAIKPA